MNYKELVSPENLFLAFDQFKRGKRTKEDVMAFERNLEENIFALSEDLQTKNYRHGSYQMFHIWDPKCRTISKPCVRDRIVHHAVFSYLDGLFDKKFLYHSYSSRVGKGTHLGVENILQMMRKVSRNFKSVAYGLKCDVLKFFATIDHGVLLSLTGNIVKENDILWLIEAIIKSFSTGGIGIPLGNLTSQIFANIYLHELDFFMKHTIRARYYVRYADDFIIVHDDQEYLINLVPQIQNFLSKKLRLKLHPNKVILRKFSQGIDFLGYVTLPKCRLIRTKTKRRMFRKLNLRMAEVLEGKRTPESLNQSMQSYLGMLSHADSFEVQQKVTQIVAIVSQNTAHLQSKQNRHLG